MEEKKRKKTRGRAQQRSRKGREGDGLEAILSGMENGSAPGEGMGRL